ncbi:MAG: zinc ribbon domain-containing protein [Candidatus Odinarchaeota archaeon]
MDDETSKLRYYSEEKYEAAIGAFVIGLIFAAIAIISLFMIAMDLRDTFVNLQTWGYWMLIPAFFLILGGFQQIYTNMKYRNAVKNAIFTRGNQGTYKLEHIALETGIRPNFVLRILLDLRDKGVIRYRFNPESGEIVLGESITYARDESYISPPKKLQEPLPVKSKDYCLYCGHKLASDSIFCENCGSKI